MIIALVAAWAVLAFLLVLLAVRRGEDANRIFALRLALDAHLRKCSNMSINFDALNRRLRDLEDDLKRRRAQAGPYRAAGDPMGKSPDRGGGT